MMCVEWVGILLRGLFSFVSPTKVRAGRFLWRSKENEGARWGYQFWFYQPKQMADLWQAIRAGTHFRPPTKARKLSKMKLSPKNTRLQTVISCRAFFTKWDPDCQSEGKFLYFNLLWLSAQSACLSSFLPYNIFALHPRSKLYSIFVVVLIQFK